MIDSAPFHGWSDKVTVFWTFGDGTPTYILTVLGIILMVGSILAWVWLEEKKLTDQVARLNAAGGPNLTTWPIHGRTAGGEDA
jgi:hypothetical protein